MEDIRNEVVNLSPEQQNSLTKEVTAAGIKDVVFSLSKCKAPGPDGHMAESSQASLSTVSPDIISAISEFFTARKLLRAFNSTSLSLIPKRPEKITDYRPISCCNSLQMHFKDFGQ